MRFVGALALRLILASGSAPDVNEVVTEAVQKAKEASDAAGDASDVARRAASQVRQLQGELPQLSAKAEDAEKTAEKALKRAEDAQKQAEELLKSVEEKAYSAAKTSARRELERLEGEAGGFYQSYLANMKLARVPELDSAAQAEAVKEAKKPYLDAEQQVEATVESYNSLAISLANEVVMYTDKAKKLAGMAVQEQETSSPVLAAKHMLEAHKLMHIAKEKKARALRVKELAERLASETLPSYQQAVETAATHAAAAFAGLQLKQRSTRLRRA
ncbi:unnamed protein product [Effrenium voratum]|uniref:Uncharacterized protein n=1 Tax=Effrenium voratum TaxID=2562239 RepID=A0AA36IMI4_9DINO|nr:unnamed protein product [Effrenium voratum]